jgi:hypothetical protein
VGYGANNAPPPTRRSPATQKTLAGLLHVLEKQTAALAFQNDAPGTNTREVLRELMTQPEPKRRPLGFVYPKEKSPVQLWSNNGG